MNDPKRKLLNKVYDAAMEALLYPGVDRRDLELEIMAAVTAKRLEDWKETACKK